MLDTSDVTTELVSQLLNNSVIAQMGFNGNNITRSNYLNTDPDLAPWIGIYKNGIAYDPATLGKHGTSFKASLDLRIVVQVSGAVPETVEDELEDLTMKVMDAIWADPTIGGKVLMVKGFDIQYSFRDTETVDQYFQWAIVSLKLEVRTG